MSNKNQAQRNRFASLPSRNETIMKQKEQAQQVEQSQMQQTPIPQTIILESNRLTSRQEDINAESYSTNHRWTTEYSNGGIQIRKGDEIRINSAYISSIGVGDLIEWDVREDSSTQNNKSNWLFSYYGCNDHLNDKRAGYNIKELQDGSGNKFGGNGRFSFDCDNSACPLMRVTETSITGTPRNFGEFSVDRYSWLQDPYLKCRFFGETFTIKTPVLDDHYEFILHPKIHIVDSGDGLEYVTGIQVIKYTGANTSTTINPRHLMGAGQTLHFKSQPEPYITNPNTNYHAGNTNDWIFTIQEFRVAHADSGLPSGSNLIVVDSLNDLTGLNHALTASISNTAKVLIGNMPSICSSGEVDPTAYQHTALSTIIWTGSTADNYIEIGDKFKQYVFYGISSNILDVNQTNLMQQVIDSETNNQVLEVKASSSNQTEAETKIKLNIISLRKYAFGQLERQQQQTIDFQFQIGSTEFNLMKNCTAGTEIQTFTSILGSNCVLFDLYGSGSNSSREIAVSFIYGGASNFTYDRDTDTMSLNNVRRNQNSNTLLDVLSLGQVLTTNVIIDNAQDYYLIKTSNLFNDFEATFAHEDFKQFRSETWNWDEQLALPINPNNRIGYLAYIKDNDNEFTDPLLTTINNRDLSHHSYQSNSFNFINTINHETANRPLKYAGYNNAFDTTHIEVKHYSQHELKIEDNYSSPSDIATALTDQTHYVGKAFNKYGVEIPNSENNGIIQNAYYIPVWTSAGSLTNSSVVGDTNPDQNKENALTGKLQGVLQPNSFFLKYKMKNSAVANGSTTVDPVYADDGEYHIYFKTKNTYINKPVAFHDPSKGFLQTNEEDDPTGLRKFSLTADLDQNKTSEGAEIPANTKETLKLLKQAETFSSKDINGNPVVIGFPIEYATDSYISQYCGSNNVSISWDDTSSRFKIDFLHMSAVSKFEPSEEGVVQEGGALSSTIYYPAPIGKNNNLYKMPRTRCGGINVENWTSQDFSNITTPQQVRTLCNLDSSVDLSTEWFVTDTTINSNNTTTSKKL